MLDDQISKKRIKSFVRRQGRMSALQKLALKTYSDAFVLNVEGKPLTVFDIFKNSNPLILEIGFGMGNSLAEMARENPGLNYLGIEVHRPGIAAILLKIAEFGLTNLRIYYADAMEVLDKHIVAGSLAGVQLFFPDPWPKQRHHKRRIVQTDFVNLIAEKLQPGGFFHLATDWQPYAEQMLKVLMTAPAFKNTAETYVSRPYFRPKTKFETRGENLGYDVWDLFFVKRDLIDDNNT